MLLPKTQFVWYFRVRCEIISIEYLDLTLKSHFYHYFDKLFIIIMKHQKYVLFRTFAMLFFRTFAMLCFLEPLQCCAFKNLCNAVLFRTFAMLCFLEPLQCCAFYLFFPRFYFKDLRCSKKFYENKNQVGCSKITKYKNIFCHFMSIILIQQVISAYDLTEWFNLI